MLAEDSSSHKKILDWIDQSCFSHLLGTLKRLDFWDHFAVWGRARKGVSCMVRVSGEDEVYRGLGCEQEELKCRKK